MLGIIAVGVSASIFITDSDMGEVGDETVGIPCGDASYDSGDSVDGSKNIQRGPRVCVARRSNVRRE